jgi:A/G-specific adenine glycosylase
MLQQTRVDTVRPYYARFIEAFPNVRALAGAHEERLLRLWQGLGYYSRARNLHRAAKVIVMERGGRWPRSAEQWEKLPGVGRYTAGAIASIAFGERVPVVDGNVKRVLARLFNIRDSIDDGRTTERLWEIAQELVPAGAPGHFNQAMMELGSTICTPRSPRCEKCPVRGECEARALGRQAKLPVRRRKKPVPHHEIVAAAIRKNGRYLLGKRRPEGLLGGLWEFPGGKVEAGETREDALAREIREELGIAVRIGRALASVRHAYSHFRITLHVYACEYVRGRPRAHYHTELKWVRRAEFDRYAFPAATVKMLDRI